MRGWKATQSKRQVRKRTKLAFIILGIVIILLLLSQAVKFTKMLFSPWQDSVHRTFFWNGDFNLNLVIKGKDISLLSFDPQNTKVVIYSIPQNSYLEVARGFGKWQLRSVYDLGASQQVGGGRLLSDTLSDFFGLPVDGFLVFSGKYANIEADSIVSESRNPFFVTSILPFIRTDLTPFELIRLQKGLSSVRFDKVRKIDLAAANLLTKEKLADGTDVYTPDVFKLDSVLSGMKDYSFASEHKTIAIFNSTNYPGLAQKAARVITNMGGDVIITSNGQKKWEKTYVVGEQSKTLDRLKQVFGSKNNIIDSSNEDLASSRAQINIFLGEDYIR